MFGWFLRKVRRLKRRKGAVKIIIDGENLLKSLKRLGRADIDILDLISNLKIKDEKEIYFFATRLMGDHQQEALVKRFKKNGVEVILKRVKVIIGGMTKKSRIDPWIGTEIAKTATQKNIRRIVLFSGDSDFQSSIEYVKECGIEVAVVSSKNDLSKELMAVADQVIYLEKLLDASQ